MKTPVLTIKRSPARMCWHVLASNGVLVTITDTRKQAEHFIAQCAKTQTFKALEAIL